MACTSASSSGRSNKESLEDCMCTICLCILIHPVTLPCGHELCMPCFKQTVEEASLSCPLCRVRISTWARKASKAKTLVNQTRWEQIQRLFPDRVQRRLNGQDDETDEEIEEREEIDVTYRRMVQLSKPGEIREEYEAELKKLAQQQERERQQEEEASAALIQRLCSSDEQEELEARQRLQEIADRDAQLAEKLDQVINEAETETPVNRLLQDQQKNYPSPPLHHLSDSSNTPTTINLKDCLVEKGKQFFVKNNKTLETFFRRLPAVGGSFAKRDVRCSSEPSTGPSEKVVTSKSVEADCRSASLSHRPDSCPVRTGKENLPELAVQPTLFGLSKHAQIYEEIEVGEAYGRDVSGEVEVGETYAKDPVTGKRTEPRGNNSVHSGSHSQFVAVVVGDDSRTRPDSSSVDEEDSQKFKPIEPGCMESPCSTSDTVPLEPCAVCITPRILFSTSKLSETTFPIDNSRVASKNRKFSEQRQADMGIIKSKLWGAENSNGLSKPGINMNGSAAANDSPVRRSRSASPPMQKVLPHRRQAMGDLCRNQYRRSTLKDSRRHCCSPVQESSSDSELVTSPLRHLPKGGKWEVNLKYAFPRRDGGGRELKIILEGEKERGASNAGLGTQDKVQGVGDSDDREVKIINSALSPNRSSQLAASFSPSKLEKNQCHSLSGGSKSTSVSLSPDHSVSSISVLSCSSTASGKMSSSPCKPTGIFDPDTVPQWTEALYANTQKGKGKRLIKKSSNSIFSQRNSPKKTRVKAVSGKTVGSSRKTVQAEDLEGVSEVISSDEDAEPDGGDKHVQRLQSQHNEQKAPVPDAVKHALTGNKSSRSTLKADSKSKAQGGSKSLKSVRKKDTDPKTADKAHENVVTPQRSIKDWFSPKQIKNIKKDAVTNAVSSPIVKKRKPGSRKRGLLSSAQSDASCVASSKTLLPDKQGFSTSSSSLKQIDSKLDTLSEVIKQLRSSPSKRRNTAPKSSTSESDNSTPSTSASTTPSKSANSTPCKRKISNTGNRGSSKRSKLSLLRDSDTHEELLSSDEDKTDVRDEEVGQEEKDKRLALRLQRQFDLADKLNLNVVRFKGTNDQYSLRKNNSQ